MKNGKWVKYRELAARGEGTESTLKLLSRLVWVAVSSKPLTEE